MEHEMVTVSITRPSGESHFGVTLDGLPDQPGLLVSNLHAADLIAQSGIQNGDVIMKINGEPVFDAAAAIQAMEATKEGEELEIDYVEGSQDTDGAGALIQVDAGS